jgi:RNA polymerase sigma factor (sigma-70 family)
MRKKKDIHYEQYQKMICAKAWSFHRSTGVAINDLISEGNMIYMKLLERYNPKRASFSTVLWTSLNNGLRTFVSNRNKIPETIELTFIEDRDSDTYSVLKDLMFKESLSRLNGASAVMVKTILNSPVETLKLKGTENPKAIRGKLVSYMRNQGETWAAIWTGMSEIKQLLKEA